MHNLQTAYDARTYLKTVLLKKIQLVRLLKIVHQKGSEIKLGVINVSCVYLTCVGMFVIQAYNSCMDVSVSDFEE